MASIQEHLDKIKNAIFGKDVRQSIHDGLNKINQETESTSKKQEKLERTFDDLIINAGNSNAEVAAARNGFETLGKRLDGVDSQLDTIENKVSLKNIRTVAKTGGEYNTIMDAVNAGGDTIENPITIKVAPGIYKESVAIKQWTRLNLVGEDKTTCKIRQDHVYRRHY